MDRRIAATRPGLLVLAAGALLYPSATEAQVAMTLDEALERALVRSPAIAQGEQQVSSAEVGLRTSWGSFLPAVSATASSSLRSAERFDPATDRIVTGSADSYSAGLSARMDVFTGGRRGAELHRSRADVESAEARLTSQRFAVVLRTKQAFIQALRQAELTEVARRRVERAEQSLELTRRQAELQMATTSDTLRARLELSVSSSPAVVAAQAGTSAARATESAVRTAYLPSIGLSSGYNWANQTASFDGGSRSWNLGLTGSYPIFNGFQREATVSRAAQSTRVARLQEEDARLAARQQADGALRALRTAEQAVTIAGEAVLVAEEDLRVVQERYRVGVARVIDLITSQIALDQARVDLVTARYDHLLAEAELEAILGREL